MSLGVAIGAITFTGSVIAFLKLDGRMSGKPILLPQRHLINAGLGIALIVLIAAFVVSESQVLFWLITLVAFVLGVLQAVLEYSTTISVAKVAVLVAIVAFLQWRPQGLYTLRTRSLA